MNWYGATAVVPLVQGNLEDGSLVFGDALRGHAIERSVTRITLSIGLASSLALLPAQLGGEASDSKLAGRARLASPTKVNPLSYSDGSIFYNFAFNLCRFVAENFFVFLSSNAMNSPKN